VLRFLLGVHGACEESAAPWLKRILAGNANDPDLMRMAAEIYRSHGLHDRAVELYQMALDNGRLDPQFANGYTDALLDAQRYGEALEFARELYRDHPASQYFPAVERAFRETGLAANLSEIAGGGNALIPSGPV